MACNKCGKPLVKADRGNITLGNPDGFDHIDCDKSAYIVPHGLLKEKKSIEVPECTSIEEEKIVSLEEWEPVKKRGPYISKYRKSLTEEKNKEGGEENSDKKDAK